ncbi:MAG: methyltransferase [Oscillospiraceae bacterium]|jgi:tRNA1(Val) A37 N6-methylase TrmN6|nr:methyltransferase [Oscillospiraceae bacterium]
MRNYNAFPVTTDALLLSGFAAAYCEKRAVRRVIDLGCGSGILALELAAKPGVSALAVDVSPDAVAAARANAESAGLSSAVTAALCDVREIGAVAARASFDLAVCNPPYFGAAGGRAPEDAARRSGAVESGAAFGDFCRAASYALRRGGGFLAVVRTERLAEAFRELTDAKLEPKLLRLVQSSAAAAPKLALIAAASGAKPGVRTLPALITGG